MYRYEVTSELKTKKQSQIIIKWQTIKETNPYTLHVNKYVKIIVNNHEVFTSKPISSKLFDLFEKTNDYKTIIYNLSFKDKIINQEKQAFNLLKLFLNM